MQSEWKVTSNYVPGAGKYYQAYRLRDKDDIDHSGNREYSGDVFADKAAAQAYADSLNGKEKA